MSNTQAFNFSFDILNTPNSTGNAIADGDRLRFSGGLLSNNTFNYEGVDYALELVGFSTNGGNTIVSEFNSPEGSLAFASLYGKFKAIAPPQPPQTKSVPEPTTLVGLTLLGLYFVTRRRQQG